MSAVAFKGCDIPINDPKWGCYTAWHGESFEKTRSAETRANARKWESSFPTTA